MRKVRFSVRTRHFEALQGPGVLQAADMSFGGTEDKAIHICRSMGFSPTGGSPERLIEPGIDQ